MINPDSLMMNYMMPLNHCMMNLKKLGHKYSSLKNCHACLLVEKYTLEKQACIVIDSDKVNQLEEENKTLKEKVDKLNTALAKFTQCSKILNIMLINQRCVFNKRSLGY